MAEKKKNNIGRPTDYKPEYCDLVIKLLDQGKSKAQVCRVLEIAMSTMQLWEETHPDFSAAINKGITYSQAVWEEMGHENICNKEFNYRIYELNMMNRFGYNKKSESKNEHNINAADWVEKLK